MENLQKNTKSQDNGNLYKEIEQKIETLENKLTILVRVIEQKDSLITSMEKKLNDSETKFQKTIHDN